MKNAILVHGWEHKSDFDNPDYPTASNSHWLPWLTKQLMLRGIHTVAPEMPQSFYPAYELWRTEFERFDVRPDTILVGHSCGGGFLIRWLSQNKKRTGKVILVAPWVGVDPDQDFDRSFFDFTWDANLVDRTQGVTIFNSTNDVEEIHKSVKIIRERIRDINLVELENKGHFTLKGLAAEAFPELLEECLR